MILKPPKGAMLNRGHPLARGLVGCWLMNEGGGNIVNDLSGNGNTGTLIGTAPSWIGGKYGPAVSLPATGNEGINLGYRTLQSTSLTVVLWIYQRGDINTSTYKRIFDAGSDDGTKGWYWAYRYDYMYAISRSGGTTLSWSVPATMRENSGWYQLIFSVNPSGIASMYVNTALVDSDTGWTPVYNNIDFCIGIQYNLTDENDIIVDNALFYNRALSASEIAYLYRSPFCMFEVDL